MKPTLKYLNDEHMRLYEWNGLGDGMSGPDRERSKRTHSWQASYAVLAVLTSVLILNGCDKQGAAEQASEQVGQAAQEPPPHDTLAAPAEAPAPAAGDAGEPAAPGTTEPAAGTGAAPAENAGQGGEPQQQP